MTPSKQPTPQLPDELWRATATALVAAMRTREVSSVEVTRAILQRIDAVEPHVNAFVTLLPEAALKAAKKADDELSRNPDSVPPLHGLPVAVKDLTPTAGVRTTYGSAHFAEHIPDEDAAAWARLKAAGAILVGKTTTPEFGWLGITESALTGVTRNPWNLSRTSGGSSGGSAASVACGMIPVASGSDGAGSIRIPAAFCGVVGLKPSLGRTPIFGEDHIYSTTEAVGPLARTVGDAALILAHMSGADQRDAFTLDDPPEHLLPHGPDSVDGLRVAYCPNLGAVPASADVATAVAAAASVFEHSLGCTVDTVDISMPDPLQHLMDFWGPASAVFLDDLRDQTGADITSCHPAFVALAERGRVTTGPQLWRSAVIDRGLIHQAVANIFAGHDLLITPTAPVTAFRHPGIAGGPTEIAGRTVDHPTIGFLPFTAPFNMTGHPAISVPCGKDRDGMPIGLQLVGRHNDDRTVLRAAAAYELLVAHSQLPKDVTDD